MLKTNLLDNYRNTLFAKIKHAFDTQDFHTVLKLCPEYMEHDQANAWVLAYFGFVISCMGAFEDFDVTRDCLTRALELRPDEIEFLILVGKMHRDSPAIIYGMQFLLRAANISKSPIAYYNLGIAYINLGELEKGLDLILYAVKGESNLKYLEDLNQFIYYDPRFKNSDYIKFAKLFYLTAKEQLKIKPFKHNQERYDKNKSKLKIGFFCAEGLNTPTWHFLEKIFNKMDKSRFEIHCYSRPPQQLTNKENEEINRIKQSSHSWKFCHLKSVKETAEEIYNDEIDILIDLSGYLPSVYGYYSTEPNMCIFMHKPAPVQITWYGFWGTTGVPEIDYLITVADNVPESQNHNFTEKIYRLQNGYTHTEIFANLPDAVTEPPCVQNGYITFASFSRATKLNSQVYKVWSEILKQVANSKLLIKYTVMAPEYTPNLIWSNFEQYGITRDRILIDYSSEERNKFLSAYNNVDIALEPIPFGGVTTTINALTMGVPVIAKYEEDRVTNGGTCSLLKAIDCVHLTANSDEEYINNAVNLAKDIEQLKNHRKTLRDKALNSSLNVEQYTKDLIEAFEFIWQDCCQRLGQTI